MSFGWINWINVAAVVCLILINIIAVRKGRSDSFSSKNMVVNLLEQIGRYACMAFMILPVFTRNWEFGFKSVAEMFIWLCLTILLLVIYSILWFRKTNDSVRILYGLAIVPVILFLMNGLLLRHPALVAAALLFGTCHYIIVKENVLP